MCITDKMFGVGMICNFFEKKLQNLKNLTLKTGVMTAENSTMAA